VVSMNRLTIANGGGRGAAFDFTGGAIYSEGFLTMTDCTVTGSIARDWGAAIMNEDRQLTMIRCTIIGPSLSGNTSSTVCGGGIFNFANLVMHHCTITGCTASLDGGGIFNKEFQGNTTMTLTHCTITGNRSHRSGGGICSIGTETNLNYCIVAGNRRVTPGDGGDLFNDNNCTFTGANIVPDILSIAPGQLNGPDPLMDSPELSALANNGGFTFTCAIPVTSPAVNAATGSTATHDQRGMPVAGVPDIGAFEFQPVAPPGPPDYPTWIAASLPPGATVAQKAASFDFDGDGVTNGDEWVAVSNPNDASSFFQGTITHTATAATVSFPTSLGRNYTLRVSSSLAASSWQDSGLPVVNGNGGTMSFTIPLSSPRRFYSVMATVP
jgi:hypothetical protein